MERLFSYVRISPGKVPGPGVSFITSIFRKITDNIKEAKVSGLLRKEVSGLLRNYICVIIIPVSI